MSERLMWFIVACMAVSYLAGWIVYADDAMMQCQDRYSAETCFTTLNR